MTVANTTCRVSYVGTNSTANFPYTFLLFAASDLVVQTQATATSAPVTLALGTDYTVSGVGSYSGGSVTLLGGNLGTGVDLSIFRNPPQLQALLLQEQTAYDAQAVMGALDDLTMMVLALQDQCSRSIQIDPLDPTTPTSGIPGPPYPSTILPPMALGLGQNIMRDAGTGTFVYGQGSGTGAYLILSTGSVQTVTGPVTFSGAITFSLTANAVTPATGNNTTLIATTAFVIAQIASSLTGYLLATTAASTYAPLANPSLTGTVTIPTPAVGTNSTQAASTAFVATAVNTGYAVFADQKTSGTAGGTSAVGAYQQRNLNTTLINTMTGSASLGTNQFTLQAGTYRIKVSAPAGGAGIHQCKLTNVTDSTLIVGTSEFSGQVSAAITAQTRSMVTAQVALAGTKTYQIDHYTAAGIASGLGTPSSTGNAETYTTVEITKVA